MAPADPQPDDSVLDEAGTALGRYRLLRKVARGGMAEVFAARSYGAHGFEKTVAIKRILRKYGDDPQFVRMMVDEAKITVLLNHPNVAQILELCEQEGDYFIVMEFVPGTSLASLRKRLAESGSRVPDLEACFITTEILQGLHAAHIQRDVAGNPAHIIHRDVSPQNVLVSADGHVKVIDFGIARARHRLELTEVGTIKGKLRYLAPEMIDPARFMKSGDFDHRVDVFAAGIVLWELIASRTLYQGDDEMAVYDAITDQDAPDLHGMKLCDKELARIVQKSLARPPEERFETAEEMADALRAYVYRREPAFTHKRVAALIDKCFATEKAEWLNLERGLVDGVALAPVPAETVIENPHEKAAERSKGAPKAPEKSSRERRAPVEPVPVPAPADAPTRTHIAGSVSGSNAPAPRGASRKNQPAEAAAGEVLTVMTLVSRPSRPSPPAVRARAPDSATGTADGQRPPPETRTIDETPHTSSELRSAPQRGARGPSRGRLVLMSAAAGTVLALALVIILELTGRGPRTDLPPPPRQTVTVTVRSATPAALVTVAGRSMPAPAVLSALAGDVIDVVVSAPGHQERTERVRLPRLDATDVALQVDLPAAVPAQAIDAGVAAPAATDAGVAVVAPPDPPPDADPPLVKPVRDDRKPDRRVDKRPGRLKVSTKSWATLVIDGKPHDDTAPAVIELPAGKHKITVTDPTTKKSVTRNVTVRAGETTVEAIQFE